jgi:hypothetical protein
MGSGSGSGSGSEMYDEITGQQASVEGVTGTKFDEKTPFTYRSGRPWSRRKIRAVHLHVGVLVLVLVSSKRGLSFQRCSSKLVLAMH